MNSLSKMIRVHMKSKYVSQAISSYSPVKHCVVVLFLLFA